MADEKNPMFLPPLREPQYRPPRNSLAERGIEAVRPFGARGV